MYNYITYFLGNVMHYITLEFIFKSGRGLHSFAKVKALFTTKVK